MTMTMTIKKCWFLFIFLMKNKKTYAISNSYFNCLKNTGFLFFLFRIKWLDNVDDVNCVWRICCGVVDDCDCDSNDDIGIGDCCNDNSVAIEFDDDDDDDDDVNCVWRICCGIVDDCDCDDNDDIDIDDCCNDNSIVLLQNLMMIISMTMTMMMIMFVDIFFDYVCSFHS